MIMCIGISCRICLDGVGLVLNGGSGYSRVFPRFHFWCLWMVVRLDSSMVHGDKETLLSPHLFVIVMPLARCLRGLGLATLF